MTQQASPQVPQPPGGTQPPATQWYEPMKTRAGSPYLADSAVTGPVAERVESTKPRRFARQSSRVSKDRSLPLRWRGGRLGRRGTGVCGVGALLVAGGA